MNFTDWAPLRIADSDLLKRIRLAYVFGNTGYEALILTKDDEFLACGAKVFGYLKSGSDKPQMKPIIVSALNKKEIIGFSATVFNDEALICAYTSSKLTYYCGKNVSSITQTPDLWLHCNMLPRKVSKVVCGRAFCLILASGELVSFGKNESGQLGWGNGLTDSLSTSKPTLIQGDLKGKIVVKIACGEDFSVCVLDSGEVYAWGSNSHGQLGWPNSLHPNLKSPTRVPELNCIIRKITCGRSHVLAVNDIGELFSWGFNGEGSLGLGDTIDHYKPTQIKTIGKVFKIAAIKNDGTSAAMDENLQVYMWGTCGDFHLTVPTKTEYETLHDVFAYFANPRNMYKPLKRHFQLESVGESIKKSFGNIETSDLTIVVENKEIFVHKAILKLRSNYFRKLLQEPWVKEDDKIIEIKQNYNGIYAYLQYIYTDNLKTTPEVALELMQIADEYTDLDLKKICEKSIRHGITVDNVAHLYNLALKLGCEQLAKYCISFAGNHVGEIIDTPGFCEWDAETAKEFIRECQKRKLFRCSMK